MCNLLFLFLHSSSITSITSSCFAITVCEFSLIIPALCFAISKISFPNISTWSYPIFAITAISPSTIFVQSFNPPRPVSKITKSHFCFAKYIITSEVIASNHFTGTL